MSHRIRFAARAALIHLLASALLAGLVALLVFGLWYPIPYGSMAGGNGLFLLVVGVDVVCGPFITLILANPSKPRSEFFVDVGLVVLIQFLALAYGMYSVAQARPVWLAFEGDRFRVVSIPDLEGQSLEMAPEELRRLSWAGPRMLGVKLSKSTDADFPESIRKALNGLHPAFRPERWVPYSEQRHQVISALRPIQDLYSRYPDRKDELNRAMVGYSVENLGYLPLVNQKITEWVVFVDRSTALPIAYLPYDGFQ